ncbi:uncharacterized protein FOMMEDRAFT_163868 [Fomitiporia mediterranea MF3/22]|uniref:Uncharacterized protein n=1 Tax=Fomitiporia mediterranea (strain MF3/22) TaxID=694068 RepID=R7SGB9_FOMME|nr:uncharacterized protein FOMMEDRAFT_163868 [Fomitiporia mediterranea MF3/22]EJC97337.1 hypothetical protein FOMMEDRAFT_163868 [Fomitiporia mediterranea MF3/22]
MDGTWEFECTRCGPIEGDVKHGMIGGEGECAWGRRGDCTLGVVSGKTYVNYWKTLFGIGQQCGMHECKCKKEDKGEKADNEGETAQEYKGSRGRQEVGMRGKSNYCAGYYEGSGLAAYALR